MVVSASEVRKQVDPVLGQNSCFEFLVSLLEVEAPRVERHHHGQAAIHAIVVIGQDQIRRLSGAIHGADHLDPVSSRIGGHLRRSACGGGDQGYRQEPQEPLDEGGRRSHESMSPGTRASLDAEAEQLPDQVPPGERGRLVRNAASRIRRLIQSHHR